jgi:hypothetical protein
MTTTFELAVVADPVADPRTQRWAAVGRPSTPETLPRVPDDPNFFDDPPYPAQSLSEVVLAADPLVELHSEQIEEEVEEADILEYLAMQEEQDNAEMDFHGLDITDQETSAGKEGDAQSTRRVYQRINRFYVTFLAEMDSLDVVLVSKDLYLPDKADHVNRKLVRFFITWYIQKTSPTSGHMAETLMFLQRKLSDATNAVGFIPRKGWIREDPWIKTFMKDMFVKVASREASQLRDLHADMDRQIPRTDQLRLVDCCYDPLVLTNLCAVAKYNVVTGYTLSSQVGSRGSDSRGMMISHGVVKKMKFLGDGEDVDHLVHNHGKRNRVGRVTYKAFATHCNPRMDSSAHLGLSALLCFSCLDEPFPNFLKPVDYALRHILRSSKSYLKRYRPSTQYSNWKKVFNHCDIFAIW